MLPLQVSCLSVFTFPDLLALSFSSSLVVCLKMHSNMQTRDSAQVVQIHPKIGPDMRTRASGTPAARGARVFIPRYEEQEDYLPSVVQALHSRARSHRE